MMDDYVINDEQPMRGTLIDAIRVIRDYINRPTRPENTLIGTKTGTIVTADDAFPAVPKNAKVYGKSTQDGTPTPDTPVPIKSVDDLTLHVCGKNLFDAATWINDGRIPSPDTGALVPSSASHRSGLMQVNVGSYTYSLVNGYANGPKYVHAYDSNGTWLRSLVATNAGAVGTTFSTSFTVTSDVAAICIVAQNDDTNVQIEYGSTATEYEPYVGTKIPVDLDNHILRSLPDGTCDELTLSYIGPSTEHEGWGVFGKTLTQMTNSVDMGTLTPVHISSTSPVWYFAIADCIKGCTGKDQCMCSSYLHVASHANSGGMTSDSRDKICELQNNQHRIFIKDTDLISASVADVKASLDGVTAIYPLDEPVVHDLGTIELPILPSPNFTFFADGGSAQPDVQISYERDITIVIDKLEAEEAPVGALGISPAITHTFEPSIELQEETEWQSDSI